MNYNIYKDSRNASWHFLLENGICTLPVTFAGLCRINNIGLYRAVDTGHFNDDERGVTFIKDGRFNILVNGSDSIEIQRYTIAHELGHIYMRHPMTDDKYGRNFGVHHHPVSKVEYQAERFAMGVLAPACVLWGLGVRSAGDIARLCCISPEDARVRANRMRELYKRDAFLKSDLEKQVYEQFKPFILHTLSQKSSDL
ncbi:MAG: ImmA/IrrE family metallo-endopeptidase [Ruminococcus sp.]|nr:ImmA/IrrE family metallo-endopeptidase [Ruminococcus sp.]